MHLHSKIETNYSSKSRNNGLILRIKERNPHTVVLRCLHARKECGIMCTQWNSKKTIGTIICALTIGGLFMSFSKISKRAVKTGRKRSACRAKKQADNTLLAETRMIRSFERAVSSAVYHAHASGNPVARYDRDLAVPYLEFPDGRKVYQNEA